MKLRRKDTIITVILLTLSLMTFLLGVTFSKGMNQFVEESLNQTPKNRILIFNSNLLDDTAVNNYIENSIKEGLFLDGGKMYYGVLGQLNEQNNLFFEFYSPAYDQFLIAGKGIDKLETGKIVLPLYFDSANNQNNQLDYFMDRSILDSGTNYLGTKIVINFINSSDEKFEKEFEVVGVYDNSKTQNEATYALLSYGDLKSISEEILNPEVLENNNKYILSNSFEDNVNIKASVKAELDQRISIKEIISFDPLFDFVLMVRIISFMISVILLTVTLIYIAIMTTRNVTTRKREVGLMYSLGYTFADIKRIFLLENMWISLAGYVTTLVLYTIFIGYVNAKIAHEGVIYILNLHFELQIWMFLFSLFIGMGSIMMATLLPLKKVNQIEITEIVKDRK